MLNFNLEPDDKIYIYTEVESDISDIYILEIYSRILDEIDKVIDGMSYKNFIDESKQYLIDNKLNTDKQTVEHLAKIIFTRFKKTYKDLIEINFEDKSISVSESIFDFEYGTAYKPALLLITHAVSNALLNLD